MIEILKEMVEAFELAANGGGINFYAYAKTGRQAIAELESQEPVAKVVLTETLELPCLQWLNLNRQFDFKGGEYLYTHPPQRKPLTDEQILNVARDHYNPHQRPEISFARAIEAAHGIKE